MRPEAPLLYDAYDRPIGVSSVPKPSGALLIDGRHVADTVQCVHCNGHFVMRAGSGITRGWCRNCGGAVCGPSCAACNPFERKIDELERATRLTMWA